MAIKKNVLLERLDFLRTELRAEYQEKYGKEPLICTDEALKEMVLKKPLKKTDFEAIPGLEKDFISLYASEFLKVISNYKQSIIKEVKVSKEAYKVLHRYKDRLTDISRSNPNLYMGRIDKIRSFDLARIDTNSLFEFLSNPKMKNFTLSQEDAFTQDLTTLYRQINKIYKETGSYNLYITYPYVEGILKKQMFAIKAPLLYIPVKLERNRREFVLKKDTEKDIVYNRDLLLTAATFDQGDLENDTIFKGGFTQSSIIDTVIPFYKKYGLEIKNSDQLVTKAFVSELKEDFIKKPLTGFSVEPYMTLGRYQLYSSMIQKDMSAILSNHKYNDLLEGLVDEKNVFVEEVLPSLDDSDIKESNISYINPLNDSQERVIELLNTHKKIVIWGPPGTGKSQTITSIIASAILKGENVLVVSEKKVALDVIYSRLKGASKYAMFLDDAENKQNFYQQLSTILDAKPPVRTKNNDVYQFEESITEMMDSLDKSLQLLYKEKMHGQNVSELYGRYLKDKDINLELTPLKVHQIFSRNIKHIDFKKMEYLEKIFAKDQELSEYLLYAKMLQAYPIFAKMQTIINRSQRLKLEDFSVSLQAFLPVYQKKTFFAKRALKKQWMKNHIEDISFMFEKHRHVIDYFELILKDQTLHTYILEHASALDKYKTKYDKLEDISISYLHMLLNDADLKNIEDIYKQRVYLFNAFYTGFLEDFYAHNQKDLYIIEDYARKMEKMNEMLDEKMDVTVESFEMELYKQALSLANTKRIMDMRRIMESHQKPSIKAWMDIFEPEMLSHIKIWMATPEVLSAVMPLRHGMFDLVIFDEASQMYVEKGIPAIFRAKKVVIAGDPKQLRPSSLGMGRIEDNDELFEDETLKDISLDAKSLLDLARYKYHEVLLNYHYRSTYEQLIAFSNQAFYDGKLMISPNQKNGEKPPIEYIHVSDGILENRRNHAEAKAVVEQIKKIFRSRKNDETIGVITFNSTQRDLIENYIDEEIFKKSTYQKQFERELVRVFDKEDQSLFVKNIENVQGDERDIIIFSMGYAKDNSGSLKRRFGWLNHEGGQNRLNVAITRAKKKIYFVSSLLPEEFRVDDLTSQGPKLLKDFMRYCYYVSNEDDTMVKTILNHLHETEIDTQHAILSHMAEDIKKRLERYGYQVQSSIGIGNYRIDLAIYDKQNQSYKLGIICDVSDTQSLSARRALLHQERYLKSRNWVIYHVFAPNWYMNPNKELKQIRDLLKD